VAGIFLSVSAPFAHEGHENDDATRSALSSSTYPRVTAHSELYELVGIVRGERLSIYLDRFATNEPVADAKVKVAIADAEPVDAAPAEKGVYTISLPRSARTGSVEIVFSVTASSGDDLLVGALTLPSDTGSSAASSTEPSASTWISSIPWPIRHPIALILITFGLGVLFGHLQRSGRFAAGIATGAAAAVPLVVLVAVSVSGNDHDHPASAARNTPGAGMSDAPRRLTDGTAFVAKPTQRLLEVRTAAAQLETVRPAVNLIGRVIGDPNRTSVVQSIHGGRVIPLEGGIPRIGQPVSKGDVLVQVDPYLPLADRTTISEKTGEIEQLIAVAETRLRRLRPLAEGNAVPRSQVADIEAELAGLRLRREAIRNTRTEPELLRAPTDGVIALAKVVPGQVVQPQDMLFQVVDPKAFWVEALVYGTVDATSLDSATAVATGGQTMPLAFRGFSRALQHHASLVHFAVSEPPPDLSIGQPVTVVAKSGAPVTGIVVPRDAVVRSGNGEAIIWLHVEPERFEPRPVRTQPFDATRVVVAAGVEEGERVVTRGADLINQIR
ncbi:MAG TPA: efflux RND transporter periplasmic adaptor subunit, partial [Gemmatimonadales bacterium]|nr:efflux RND transporter periplasmic adaptor subunit [Gemmatimonadales bacterium]